MDKYNTTKGKVNMELRRLGYTDESRKPKREDLYKLFVEEGWSTKEIANKYGYSPSGINSRLRYFGIKDEDKYKRFIINPIQHDILIGSILGDGCISNTHGGETYCLTVSHAENQKDYLNIKFNHMRNLCNMASIKEKKFKKEHGSYNKQKMYWFCTRYIPQIAKYRKLSLNDILNSLNKNSLTIWFMDDGRYDAPSSCWKLGASRFTEEELSQIIDVFKRKFNTIPSIDWLRKDRTSYKGIKYSGLRFNKRDSEEINKVIETSVFYNDLKKIDFYKVVH